MQNSMDKIYIFVIILISGTLLAATVAKEYQLKTSVALDGKYMTADHIGSSYVINQDNQVIKYDSLGNLVGRYSEERYGELTSIDVTSPFNILLFFQEYATVVATDNNLNAKTLFRLASLGADEVSAIGLSHDNYVWYFDTNESKLKKVNTQYEIIHESMSISELLGVEINPTFIIERERRVYVSDPDVGVLVFDIYGNYYNSFPILGLSHFQVLKNNIVYTDENKLQILNLRDFEVRAMPLPESVGEIKDIHLESNLLYVLNNEALQLYSAR